MIDLSEEPMDENIETCVKYLERMSKMDMLLEMEVSRASLRPAVQKHARGDRSPTTSPARLVDGPIAFLIVVKNRVGPSMSLGDEVVDEESLRQSPRLPLRPRASPKHAGCDSSSTAPPQRLVGGSIASLTMVKNLVEPSTSS